jgi:hypothetical protein
VNSAEDLVLGAAVALAVAVAVERRCGALTPRAGALFLALALLAAVAALLHMEVRVLMP